ncbi:MAG TPA: heme lyase CcmF/NrfE family subunit [Kofleriaceae bacterium]|nr:heme lyase CcmF/NrfE family subunit [Kofleriaceae bacterium]
MPDTSALSIPTSPIATLGTVALLVAFVVAAYATAAGIIGHSRHRPALVRSSVHSLYGFFALMALASALLIYAFVTHDYTIKYVAHYSDTSMPVWYKITAYWGGLDGSLMFWVFVLAAFASIAVKTNRRRHADMIGYVVATVMVVELFFLALLIYDKNPFATFLTDPPVDGKGLAPLLQNYWMVIHPPSLYTGFVAATIPFAFGIAALASGRLDDRWIASVRVWMLISWFFLSLGLILGGRWAYEELGWGGYWAWDPVENAGLIPWFTATAFLHSAMIQEQRGMMKSWNVGLVVLTFFFTIFGTFMTRSGIVQSVHAFGQDNQLALLFILFLIFVLVVSVGLLAYRFPQLQSAGSFDSFISREVAFLVNNWLLLACALFVLFATMFPTISEAVRNVRITVGAPFFNRLMVPLGLLLLILAGIAPLLAWRKTTVERLKAQFVFPVAFSLVTTALLAILIPATRARSPIFHESIQLPVTLCTFMLVAFVFGSVGQEFWRGTRVRMRQTGGDPFTSLIGLVVTKRRRYGGYIVHAAIAIMFCGFAGKVWGSQTDVTVTKVGEHFSVRGYEFIYHGLEITSDDHKTAVTANVTLLEDGDKIDDLVPAKWRYVKQPEEPTTEVSITARLSEDIYLVLTGFEPEKGVANFRVYINPLVDWVWIGFFVLMLGTAICLLPASLAGGFGRRRGRAPGTLIALLACGGLLFGSHTAFAQKEHATAAPVHDVGVSVAQYFRPNDPEFLAPFRAKAEAKVAAAHPDWKPDSAQFNAAVNAQLAPVVALAQKLMEEIVCLCGGCPHEAIATCKCGVAAQNRRDVLKLLGTFGLLDEATRGEAHDEVIAAFVKQAGGQHILAMPINEGFNRLAWAVPYAALAGALVLLYGVGRRWVRRGENQLAVAATEGAPTAEDEDYADRFDDELREID